MSATGKRYQRFGKFEFAIKVLAAFSALIPFLAGLLQLKETLKSPKMQLLFNDRKFFVAIAFGIAYAATNDISATAVAIVLALLIFDMGQEDPENDGDFSFGYGTVVGMTVQDASEKVKRVSPALNVVVVDDVQTPEVLGRFQIIRGSSGRVTGYVIG